MSSTCRSRFARSGKSRGLDGLGGRGGRLRTESVDIGRIFREEYGRAVAALTRFFGDLDIAEDAVQEAFLIAVQKWPEDGLPPNPGGWITTTARNRALDGLRRHARGRELLAEVALLSADHGEPVPNEEEWPVPDERLRLIFTCCHPALHTDAQVALTLRLLGGLSADEVARAFLISEAAMAQRLARAKRKIKAARIPYRVPKDHEMPDRLRAVLAVIYLIYNAGPSTRDESELCAEAIRLARILARLMADGPESVGLLALLLFTESRRASRTRPDGSLVVLGEQDRSQWNHDLISEAQTLLRRYIRLNMPGPLPASSSDQRRPRRSCNIRADELVAHLRTVRRASYPNAEPGGGTQPRDRSWRGPGTSCRTGTRRAPEPGELLPVPRHPSRPPAEARSRPRSSSRLRTRSPSGPNRGRRTFLRLGGRATREER